MRNRKLKICLGVALTIILIAVMFIGYCIIALLNNNTLEIVDKPTEEINYIGDVELPDIDNSNNKQDKTKESGYKEDNIYKEEKKEDEIINILLCGMDARKYETNSRSDTIILASYNKTQHKVKLVSFMRDSWVYLPERGWSRINAATAYGGTGLLINTLNYNFGLDIQDYIQIKFDDFKRVIDILGGIDVELTKQEINYINKKLHVEDRDWNNDIKEGPGVIHLNGTQVLWHCRNRTIGNSDFSRTDRQREVLTIIINKAMNMNISQAIQMIYEMKDYINTNISIKTIVDLGTDALISKSLQVETARIPFDETYKFANKNGASVLEMNIEENKDKLYEFIGYDIGEQDENREGESDKSAVREETE